MVGEGDVNIFDEEESPCSPVPVTVEVKARSVESGVSMGASLCGSCRFGLVYRRRASTEASGTYCSYIGQSMPNDIVECSRYRNIKDMDMVEMLSMAKYVDGRVGVNDKSYR